MAWVGLLLIALAAGPPASAGHQRVNGQIALQGPGTLCTTSVTCTRFVTVQSCQQTPVDDADPFGSVRAIGAYTATGRTATYKVESSSIDSSFRIRVYFVGAACNRLSESELNLETGESIDIAVPRNAKFFLTWAGGVTGAPVLVDWSLTFKH